MSRSAMPRSPLVATVLVAAMASAVPPARADEEAPDAQARAVAALPGATVRNLVPPPPLSITGLGGGGARAISGRVAGIDRAMRELGARVIGQEVHVELPADVLFSFDK